MHSFHNTEANSLSKNYLKNPQRGSHISLFAQLRRWEFNLDCDTSKAVGQHNIKTRGLESKRIA